MPVVSTAQRKACRTYYIKNIDRLKEVSNKYNADHKDAMLAKKKLKYREYRARLVQTISEIQLPLDEQPHLDRLRRDFVAVSNTI